MASTASRTPMPAAAVFEIPEEAPSLIQRDP
jgi:hypothetical protein